MSRNYSREAEWTKKRYKRLEVRLLKEDADKLQTILDRTGQSIAAWVRLKIEQDSTEEPGVDILSSSLPRLPNSATPS